MNKRKLVLLASALCIVAILAVGGTLAYFTDTDDQTNTFTVGNVDIDLTEPLWDEGAINDATDVYPGKVIDKDPTVTNTGVNPCFIRIRVTGWDCLEENNEGAGDIVFLTDDVIGKVGEHWVYNEADDYFYYLVAIEAEDSTTALFEQVQIPAGLTNAKELPNEFDLVVYAEAVQSQGSNLVADATTKDVELAGLVEWFTTCMPANQQ